MDIKTKDIYTEKQRETLDTIQAFIGDRGFPPSMRELADIQGISLGTINQRVNALIRKGYIEKTPSTARGIKIVRH